MPKKEVLEAITTLVGAVIGAGVLSVPYVIAEAGFLTGLLDLLVLGGFVILLYLLYGEVVLRTKGVHQLTGYAERYLGKTGKNVALISMTVGIYSALIAYFIGVGASMSQIFGGNPLIFSLIFFVVGVFLVHRGIKAIEESELMQFVCFCVKSISVFFIALGGVLASSLLSAGSQPNVLFIVADDLGHSGLNCYRTDGADWLETPRLDALAGESMKFTNGLSAYPTCQPSRMAILSGQYGPRTGGFRVSDNHKGLENKVRFIVPEKSGLPLETITIAESFQQAGYATAMYGKWHAGSHPSEHGFDVAYESTKHFMEGGPSGDKYPTPKGHGFKCVPEVELPDGMHAAQLFTGMAKDWLSMQVEAEQPFFLYMPYYVVHAPFESLPELEEYFFEKLKNVELKDPKKADDKGRQATPNVAAQTKMLDE